MDVLGSVAQTVRDIVEEKRKEEKEKKTKQQCVDYAPRFHDKLKEL